MIFEAIAYFTRRNKQDENTIARPHASIASMLANFGKTENSTLTPASVFLPHPDMAKQARVSPQTLRVLVRLIESGILPPRVEAAARSLEEVTQALE